MKSLQRVFSGIQPSGEIHIGNYLGAVKKWVELSESYDCIYCVVDDHAITVDYDRENLPKRTVEAVMTAMACGLDPEKCTLFVQSHVPEHTELTWLFDTIVPLGSLFRMTQFKEKSRNALHKAIAQKGSGAKAPVLHELKNLGQLVSEQLVPQMTENMRKINPDGDTVEEVVVALNSQLGDLMARLQTGLGVSEASAALFSYPVLQASDILLYHREPGEPVLVPVGQDQEQHLELCREIAERFNRKFGDVFPMAQRVSGEAPRIMGLDGKSKMSKSLNNHIGVLDNPEVIGKKLARAFTDPQRVRKSDPGRPEVCNIFSLHGYFTDSAKRDELSQGCKEASIGCFECKKALAQGIEAELAPVRERSQHLVANPSIVLDVLDAGAARCREIAAENMEKVRCAMGIGRSSLNSLPR